MGFREAERPEASDEKDEHGDADVLVEEGLAESSVEVAMIETFDVDKFFRKCEVSMTAWIVVEGLVLEPIMRVSKELILIPVFTREKGRE